MPGFETGRVHGWPANPLTTQIGLRGAQAIDDTAGQQVARGLARDHADSDGHGRMMPRVEASKKSIRTCSASAASGCDCWRARSSARASSNEKPRRNTILYASRRLLITEALKPRRLRPSTLMPTGRQGL